MSTYCQLTLSFQYRSSLLTWQFQLMIRGQTAWALVKKVSSECHLDAIWVSSVDYIAHIAFVLDLIAFWAELKLQFVSSGMKKNCSQCHTGLKKITRSSMYVLHMYLPRNNVASDYCLVGKTTNGIFTIISQSLKFKVLPLIYQIEYKYINNISKQFSTMCLVLYAYVVCGHS